jgi:hypothetical protein
MHAARDYEDYDAQYDAVAFEEEHSDGEDQHHDVAVIGRTGNELTCLLCHSAGHLFRQCPGLEAAYRVATNMSEKAGNKDARVVVSMPDTAAKPRVSFSDTNTSPGHFF